MVKHWSSTQRVVTLSSAEAELTGIVKGSTEGLGLRSLAADLGWTSALKVFTDSSVAMGICKRTGTGKVRHLAMPGPQTLRGMQVTPAVWRTQCEHRRASDARTIDYSTAAS